MEPGLQGYLVGIPSGLLIALTILSVRDNMRRK